MINYTTGEGKESEKEPKSTTSISTTITTTITTVENDSTFNLQSNCYNKCLPWFHPYFSLLGSFYSVSRFQLFHLISFYFS